ncbi:MAG: hypothetical protein M3Q07_05970, partial [Pseudobdellovibrionaceae bacterium]|nr:hypothetical protein [Pseudobdellovibrionaceae bacterium]
FPRPRPLAIGTSQPGFQVFNETLGEFLGLLSAKGECQFLFIDDLQWADWQSLQVLGILGERIFSDRAAGIMLMGTFRSNEIDADHPLIPTFLDHARQFTLLELGPLEQVDSNLLVEMLLDEKSDEVSHLQDTCYRFSLGNPFYVYEYLKSAIHTGIFALNEQTQTWHFNPERIHKADLSSGVAGLVVERIRTLNEIQQALISITSLAGQAMKRTALQQLIVKLVRFRPGLKEHVESAELEQTLELCYQELLQKNILSPATDRFTLFHDKVQEASYSLLSQEENSFLHYEYAVICIAGIDSTADKGNNSAVFEAAYHVCRGHQKELPKAIRKFLIGAATAARQVFAYDKAREYLQTLIEAIDGQPETDPDETFNALELLADTLVMSDQIAAALELYDKLLAFDCDPIRRALIYAKKVEFCLNLFDYQNARRACEAGLDVLGERIFTTEIRSYLYIFASLPFLVIYAVYFKLFGRQTKEIKTELEEIRFQLLIKSEISQYFTQPIVAIANIIPLTFELLTYKDNKHRASLFGYWGIALCAFGIENFANTCFRHAYNYFDRTANPVDKSFVLFCWGFASDVPRGNLQAGQRKIEEALSNLAPLGESFWRSMCTLGLLLLDYYGAENGQAGLRSHEFIELWKKIRFAATPLGCVFRHSLESGNREQAEKILAHVEAADLNLQTLGYDTLDSVLGCLGVAEYFDSIEKPEQAEKFAKRTFKLTLKRSHRVTFALFPPILYARVLIKQNRKFQELGILGIAWINQLLRVRVFHPQTCYESGRWFFALGWPRVGRMIIERGIRFASARNWLTPAAEGRLLLGELMQEFDPDLAHVYVHMARQHFQVRNWKFHENLCEQVLNNRKSTRNEETEGSLVTEHASRSVTRRSTALRQQVETRALMDILLKLSATNDTTTLYQGLLESLCQATGAELAVLYFRENERWFPHAAHNIRIEAADLFKVKVDQHFVQKTLQASPTEPIIRKSEGQQWGRRFAAGSVMLLPLKSEGTIAGYCYLANTQLYDLFS